MKPSVVTYCRALACETRLYILRVMGEAGMSVTDIASSTGIATSTTSFHLNELVRVGLVTKRRKGRNVLYRWSPVRLSLKFEKVTPAPLSPSSAAP